MNEEPWKGQNGVLSRLEGLLGKDVFFLPCIRGTKVPAVTYTQRPFEATQTPAYRYALASGEFTSRCPAKEFVQISLNLLDPEIRSIASHWSQSQAHVKHS